MHPGAVNRRADKEAIRVGEDLPFVPLDLLACVRARDLAAFSRMHPLTVDHLSAWLGTHPKATRSLPAGQEHDKQDLHNERCARRGSGHRVSSQ